MQSRLNENTFVFSAPTSCVPNPAVYRRPSNHRSWSDHRMSLIAVIKDGVSTEKELPPGSTARRIFHSLAAGMGATFCTGWSSKLGWLQVPSIYTWPSAARMAMPRPSFSTSLSLRPPALSSCSREGCAITPIGCSTSCQSQDFSVTACFARFRLVARLSGRSFRLGPSSRASTSICRLLATGAGIPGPSGCNRERLAPHSLGTVGHGASSPGPLSCALLSQSASCGGYCRTSCVRHLRLHSDQRQQWRPHRVIGQSCNLLGVHPRSAVAQEAFVVGCCTILSIDHPGL